MTENSLDPSAQPVPDGPDADWPARIVRPTGHAMEELVAGPEPVSQVELQDACVAREPLTSWDASLTNSGAVRAWTNLGWNLTTNVEHAGWLHATRDGFRATVEGRAALGEHPSPQDFFQASVDVYYQWDALRKSTQQPAEQPSTAIAHGGSGFAHASRAAAPVLAAWRKGDSALSPGLNAWGGAAAAV